MPQVCDWYTYVCPYLCMYVCLYLCIVHVHTSVMCCLAYLLNRDKFKIPINLGVSELNANTTVPELINDKNHRTEKSRHVIFGQSLYWVLGCACVRCWGVYV